MHLLRFSAPGLLFSIGLVVPNFSSLVSGTPGPTWTTLSKRLCRYIPEDAEWPSAEEWRTLNNTVGGNLFVGVPLAQPCYSNDTLSSHSCQQIRDDWAELSPRIVDPVHVGSPYWVNTTCSPFLAGTGSTCTLGNIASYAIKVDSAETVAVGLHFAQEHNIRLTIKNTGHDFLGRSTGRGALALWTHHLKDITFLNYTSAHYIGPAVRLGAGVQGSEAYEAAKKRGLRVAGGDCRSVGLAGGWTQGGGHGHLGSLYGLGADNTLEFEVVTVAGEHLIVSRTQHADFFWALSGGGPGNYAIVLSATIRAHPDGQVAGARLSFDNDKENPGPFWQAVDAWLRGLPQLLDVPGLAVSAIIDNSSFTLDFTTLPDATADELSEVLQPFLDEVAALNIPLTDNQRHVHPTWLDHYYNFTEPTYATHAVNGGRLIPEATLEDPRNRSEVLNVIRHATEVEGAITGLISGNYSLAAGTGQDRGYSSVVPAWRDSAIHINMVLLFDPDVSWQEMRQSQDLINEWQLQLREIAPNSGAYPNEATYDNVNWKQDYYGANYGRLLEIKRKYDPSFTLWAHVAVGSDEVWALEPEGRLCAVSQHD